MNVVAALPLQCFKEARALAFPSLACLACMAVPAAIDAPHFIVGLSIPAYFLGTAAIGALSIGHEYSGRTLSLLLSLPERRERLLAVKLGVLAPTLAMLYLVAGAFVFRIGGASRAEQQMAALLPALCGLFLAPWLTMTCRNATAGAVFTVAIPGVLLVAGELIGVAMYGDGPEMHAFRMAFVQFGTLGFCALGGVMGWRLFTRLEAIEGVGQDLRLPQWLRTAGGDGGAASQVTRRNPNWLLVKKEIRLQQLALTLAALYALVWALAASSTHLISDLAFSYTLGTSTVLYASLLSMLIGSTASAGERQIGTLGWQMLLPMAASKQWSIKVAVALGLAAALGIGLPIVLMETGSLLRATDLTPRPPLIPAIAIVSVLAAGSLYVSTLCRSGMWALLMSVPAVVGAVMFLRFASEWTRPASNLAAKRVGGWLGPDAAIGGLMEQRIMTVLAVLLIGSFTALLLQFALANHFSDDRVPSRVWKQVIISAAFATAAIMAMAILQAV